MIKIIYLIGLLLFFSCEKDNSNTVHIVKIQKIDNVLAMDIKNNTKQDYYIFNPEIGVYTMDGANMIKTELITHHTKSQRIDSLICEIFPNDCFLHQSCFSKLVKLPKENITRLEYTYNQNFDENNVKYIPSFPYNIDQFQKHTTTVKIYQLKKKLDENNILKNYEVYIKRINY